MTETAERAKTNVHLFFNQGEMPEGAGLVAKLCEVCGHHNIGQPAVCANCVNRDLKLVSAGQRGKVVESSLVHHPAGGFDAPYVIATIQTTEGMTLFSPLLGTDEPPSNGSKVAFCLLEKDNGDIGFGYQPIAAEDQNASP